MNTITQQRFNKLFVAARAAKQSLDAKGFIQRNRLPKVTLAEHHWLVKNHPKMAGFTRTFDYEDDVYLEDTNRMSSARPPRITTVWVGARSLGCVMGETAEHESEGLSASQLDQENAAELTDLQTLLYQDPAGFHEWLEAEVTSRLEALRKPAKNVIYRKAMTRQVLKEVPKDLETGMPLMSMIEDEETGKPRPIRNGDCITIVRGSNDDLDSLFLEEADDPRVQNDLSAEGTDHKWSGRFRANTQLEENFLTDRSYKLPNSAAPEGLRWQPDEFTTRRLAQNLVAKILERRPEWENQILSLTDEAEERIKRMARDLKFDGDGNMVGGYFITRNEFFGTVESNLMQLERERCEIVKRQFAGEERPRQFKRHKAPPAPVNWDAIRASS